MEEYNSNSGMLRGVIVGFLSAIVVFLAAIMCKEMFVEETETTGDKIPVGEVSNMFSSTEEILGLINNFYYYTDDDYFKDLETGIYKGIISTLDDKYAAYYSPEEWRQILQDDQGVYYGIGVVVQQDVTTGEVIAVTPYENGPGYAAGIRAGDRIIAVNGQSILEMTLEESVSLIRGEEGTSVVVTIKRDGVTKDLTVTRAKIENQTIAYEMLEGNIGYVRISAFEGVTAEQFANALTELQKQGVKGYIFDVRSNGGGYYNTVVNMLDKLLPEGKIVYIEDKNGKQDVEYSDAECIDLPMCVLVDEYTASASEIFAGAIQDYKKGAIIGVQTFGKGIVQNTYVLRSGGAVKFTIASYFTPNGRNIHGEGITPDIKIELPKEESAYKDGVLLREYDSQLNKALEYLSTIE
jgi:carboxyl-terminal processing protease